MAPHKFLDEGMNGFFGYDAELHYRCGQFPEETLRRERSVRRSWIRSSPNGHDEPANAPPQARPLHFCRAGHAQKSDPRHVVSSIVFQLSTQLFDYDARLAMIDVEKPSDS